MCKLQKGHVLKPLDPCIKRCTETYRSEISWRGDMPSLKHYNIDTNISGTIAWPMHFCIRYVCKEACVHYVLLCPLWKVHNFPYISLIKPQKCPLFCTKKPSLKGPQYYFAKRSTDYLVILLIAISSLQFYMKHLNSWSFWLWACYSNEICI